MKKRWGFHNRAYWRLIKMRVRQTFLPAVVPRPRVFLVKPNNVLTFGAKPDPTAEYLVNGVAVSVVQPEEMSMSFLKTLGKDVKSVFAWLGSSKGQAVVAGAEATAEGVVTALNAPAGAALTAGVALVNNWIAEAVKMEALASAAGSQDGTGTQKAAAVLSTMVPELTSYLSNAGYTSANITAKATTINNLVVQLLNTLEAPDGVQQAQNTATGPSTTTTV